MDLMEIKLQAYDTREKKVSATGNSGHVILPKEWIGKKVRILLIEPVNQKGD